MQQAPPGNRDWKPPHAADRAVVEIRVCATLIGFNKVDHRGFSLLAANAGHWPNQYLFPPGLCVQPAQIRPTILIVMRVPPLGVGRTVITSRHEKPRPASGGRGAGASIPRWRERGHSRICHPSVGDQVDRLPWRVIGPHGNVRQ
jgi:hypothetical protein